MHLVTSPGLGLMGMLAHWPFSSQQPLRCVLLDPAPGAQCIHEPHPSKIPLQARLRPAPALHHTAPLQGAGLPRCKRWVLLCWAGAPHPPVPATPQLLPGSLHPPASLLALLGIAMSMGDTRGCTKAMGIVVHVFSLAWGEQGSK